MLQPAKTTTTPPAEHAGHASPGTSTATNALPAPVGTVAYVCPMPEHVAIKYHRPGKCPLCGMALVPVTAQALAKLTPGGKVLHYTCPMTEHADVKLGQSGKCPKCAMTLIPVMQPAPLPSTTPAPGHKH